MDAAEKHILKLVEKVSDDLIKNKRKIFLLTGYFLGWDRRMRRRRRRDWLFCRAATAADAAGSRSLRRPSLLLLRPAPQPPPPLATGDTKNRPTGSTLLFFSDCYLLIQTRRAQGGEGGSDSGDP